MICKKCNADNWGYWTSSSSKIHAYCKTCRQSRAHLYTKRKKEADGSHTKSEWLNKLKQFSIIMDVDNINPKNNIKKYKLSILTISVDVWC